MTDLTTLIAHGQAWLFIPSAILLGALHGLEPGHSKTMMAAFIVAIRGTLPQAILLGVTATISHTAVVWAVAIPGMYFGRSWDTEAMEPYFQLISAGLIVAVALWMMWRTWHHQNHQAHGHSHGHHDHNGEASRLIDTGHGTIRLAVFEDGVPPRFRLYREEGHGLTWSPDDVHLVTERPDGQRQEFAFADRDGYFESTQEIPEPHEFVARLQLGHGGHSHDYDIVFIEHDHPHAVPATTSGLDLTTADYQDAHELAHANDIRRRFANQNVTTGQLILFGLTGGLIPCPASITVLLLCLQLKRVVLGATLVLCFSVGLALTMVLSGAVAALGMKHATMHWHGLDALVRKAPYISGLLIVLVGLYVAYHGWLGLSLRHG